MLCGMPSEQEVTSADQVQEQVQRILASEGFHSAEDLRRLLQYLAKKSVSGRIECLKEYTIAVEGMGKPHSYDPKKTLRSEFRREDCAKNSRNTIAARVRTIRS